MVSCSAVERVTAHRPRFIDFTGCTTVRGLAFYYFGSVERRAPISFDENFNWFSKSILEWFFPAEALKAHLGLYIIYLWILIFGLIVFC